MNLRSILFQVHLWTGLALGMVLALIGLSGSLLVYDHDLLAIGAKPLPKADTPGEILSLDALIASARDAVDDHRVSATIAIPHETAEAAVVRFQKPGRGGPATEIYLDPASGRVLDSRRTAPNAFFALLHRFHGNLAFGREGRQAVGWLGVAMLLLGFSGLVLWWPKAGAWKGAFGVRKKARGYWMHRQLHGAAGIWCWIVFIMVSFSGVAIVFPDTTRAAIPFGAAQKPAHPAFDPRRGPEIAPVPGVLPIGADAARGIVLAQWNDADVRSIALPARRNEAIRVTVGDIEKGPVSLAYIDPYRRAIVGWRNPPGADRFMAWQRPLHAGSGWGAVWRALVFVSGLLPALFVTTGIVMWLKKRRTRRRVPVLEGVGA